MSIDSITKPFDGAMPVTNGELREGKIAAAVAEDASLRAAARAVQGLQVSADPHEDPYSGVHLIVSK